jgi:hypothetical protein
VHHGKSWPADDAVVNRVRSTRLRSARNVRFTSKSVQTWASQRNVATAKFGVQDRVQKTAVAASLRFSRALTRK